MAAEVVRTSGELRLRVTGASMLPTIWPGDVLHVQRARPDDLYIGDVVLFARNGGLVAHRAVGIRSAGDRVQESGVRTLEAEGSREKPQGRSREAEGAIPNRRLPIPPTVSRTPYPVPRDQAQSPTTDSRTLVPDPQFLTTAPQSLPPDPLFVITRGDSVGHDDAPVSAEELLGLVTAIERRGRQVSTRLTAWRRAAAGVLCRSEFCTRAALWLHRRYQGRRTSGE